MNRLYLFLILLLFPVTMVQSQQSNTSAEYEKFILDDSFYVDPWKGQMGTSSDDQSLSWFVNLTEGDYRLNFEMYPNQKDAEYQLNISISATEGKNFTPISKVWMINAQTAGNYYLNDIHIPRQAFYKIEIKPKELKGSGGVGSKSMLIETPKNKGGKARFAKWKTSPSVHLKFMPDDEKKYEYDWLYGEIQVPVGYDPMYTFWMGIGFYRGYFGIQVNSDTERRVLFSVWDSSNEAVDRNRVKLEDRVVLLDKTDEVHVGSFGNEGTGGQSYWKYNWTTGIPVKFLMNMRKLDGDFVVYSAWFMDKESEGWKYMASWQAPREKRYFDGFYSFVENFGRGTGQMVRKADFYNMWGRRTDNKQWTEFNKAKLTHTDGEADSRSDYAGGVSKNDPARFYMSSGGYTDPVDDGKTAVAKKTNTPPKVDITVLSAVVDKAIERKAYLDDVAIIADKKVEVSRAEASDAQPGEDVSKSIDGDMSTIYHSRWSRTTFPVTLTYFFEDAEQIDYLIYYPRTEGSNGNFKEVEIWVSTGSQPQFVKTGDYDFKGSSSPSKISFPDGLKSPKAVRFVVKSGLGDGGGGYASCAEMAFFLKSPQPAIPPVFTDETCSELRSGVDRKTVDAIANGFFRRMASSLLDNNYDAEFRVQEYKPYPRPEKMAEKNKTSTYNLLDNPTGISVKEDEEIIVFVGNTGGENVSLRLIESGKGAVNSGWGMNASTYLLNEGPNRIVADRKGLLYVMYHTDNPGAKPVKIHIATGKVNGYYDVAKHKPEDWKRLLDKAQDEQFDMLGKYAHVTFPVASLRTYCPNGDRLIQVYDSISWLEQKFIGLYKYDRANVNRMYFHVDYNMPSGWGAYATAYRTAYPLNSLRELCNADKLRSTDIWGPAHEVGHVNQTRPGFRWGGMGEVSNNVYSMYVQHAFGNKSRLADEKLGRGDGGYNNRYEKGFTEMLAAQALHSTYNDVFCKLIPFWQLELYYAQVKGNTDFYADVHEQVRLRPDPVTDSEAILAFVKICCDAAGEDLTDFFKTWGLLRAVDYKGNYEGYGSGQLTLACTQAQVDEVVRYAKKYPKPVMNLQYIHDDCVDAFRKSAKLSKGTITVDKSRIKLTGWENVAVFEVYDGDKLVFITPKTEFNIPSSVNQPVIYAVPAKGKTEKIVVKGYVKGEKTQIPNTLSAAEKIYGLSKFWQEVNYNFIYLDKIDRQQWDNAYKELITKVQQTENDYQYYRELQKFCAMLNDGHTNIHMPQDIQVMNAMFGDYRLLLENIGGKAIVTRVNASKKNEIPIGSEIIEVNGMVINEYIERFVAPYIASSTDYIRRDLSISYLLQGLEGDKYAIKLKKPDGSIVSLNLTHAMTKENDVYPSFEDWKLFDLTWYDNGIAYIALNSFSDEKIVDLFIEKLPLLSRQAKGLIIDLRKNGGGSTNIGTGILQYLTKDNQLYGSKNRSRMHIPSYKAWGKFVEAKDTASSEWSKKSYLMFHDACYYDFEYNPTTVTAKRNKVVVPTAILTGHGTASAAEDFLIYADNQKHMTRIGDKTYGSTGQPLMFSLPGGGSARICTKQDRYPDGREFVGYGVLPDIEVVKTLDDYLQNRDPVLSKALEYLKGKMKTFQYF